MSWLGLVFVLAAAISTGCLSTATPTEVAITPETMLTPTATPSSKAQVQHSPLPTPPDRDLYALARSLLIKDQRTIPRVVNPEPVSYSRGRQDTFNVVDLFNTRVYSVRTTLQLVTEHAYWYVEDGLSVSLKKLTEAAQVFEESIYPRVTQVFGTEWTPGVDNDPHLTILHARLRGVAGYYSGADEYPVEVHQHSNQREMIYINAASLVVGSEFYLSTLAHELQHAVHWNADSGEETWVSEGLSQVAESVAGYQPQAGEFFRRSATTSFSQWPLDPRAAAPYYGGSFIFMQYLADHYGTQSDLRKLVEEPMDGIEGINSYLSGLGYSETFVDVFKDWLVANVLDEPGNGRYSHINADFRVRGTDSMRRTGEFSFSGSQYAARYIELRPRKPSVRLHFQGATQTPLLPDPPHSGRYCWWSNQGDSISTTLTRKVDLRDVAQATVNFQVWYDVEEDWDYGYVQVSTDGGATWDILEGRHATPRNPVGNSFGPGYSGSSKGWQEDGVDLSKYAGQEILLRFHYVTDDAINGSGLCFDDISIPEIGFFDDGETEDGQWEAEGFVRTDNRVPQSFIVLAVLEGEPNRVVEMELDASNTGELVLEGLENAERTTIIVAPFAQATRQEASYTLTVEAVQ